MRLERKLILETPDAIFQAFLSVFANFTTSLEHLDSSLMNSGLFAFSLKPTFISFATTWERPLLM